MPINPPPPPDPVDNLYFEQNGNTVQTIKDRLLEKVRFFGFSAEARDVRATDLVTICGNLQTVNHWFITPLTTVLNRLNSSDCGGETVFRQFSTTFFFRYFFRFNTAEETEKRTEFEANIDLIRNYCSVSAHLDFDESVRHQELQETARSESAVRQTPCDLTLLTADFQLTVLYQNAVKKIL